MAYTNERKIQSLLGQFDISGSTKPNTAQVAILMSQVDGELDAILAAAEVTVPVTSPTYFVDWLEGIASAGVAARVLKSMFPDHTGPGETPAHAFWQRLYDRGIGMIKDGSILSDDVVNIADVEPSTYFTRNPDTEEDTGDIAEPAFKMGDRL